MGGNDARRRRQGGGSGSAGGFGRGDDVAAWTRAEVGVRGGAMSWSKPRREPTQSTYTPRPRAPAVAVAGPARATVAVPKMRPGRDEAHRRAVAALPCVVCGIHGYSQAAHPNTGKGAGIKADDRECFPLCADRPLIRGCHSAFDQGAMFPKAERRSAETRWIEQTRRALNAA